MSKVLGVLGGLGPMATAYFYELVIARTQASTDQDHIDMIISSKASTPDRTAFILGKSTQDPFLVMRAEAQRLIDYGAQVIAIPCNTAHYFHEELAAEVSVPVLNMVEDTVRHVLAQGGKKVGILATDGTLQAQTYHHVCRQHALVCVQPHPEMQKLVMQMIYDDIKSGRMPQPEMLQQVAQSLFLAGCDFIVLGCTELSLLQKTGQLDNRFVDSMTVLADSAIRACGKQVRRPL